MHFLGSAEACVGIPQADCVKELLPHTNKAACIKELLPQTDKVACPVCTSGLPQQKEWAACSPELTL